MVELSLGLPADAPRVWQVLLAAVPQPARADWSAWLSAAECVRADRYRNRPLQAAFVASRIALRSLLGQLSGQAAREVEFGVGSGGKPFLAPAGARGEFNLSHADGVMLVAWHARHAVGIDLEAPAPDLNPDQVAAHVLTAGESAEVARRPGGERLGHFLRFWTAKEAILKVSGDGLQRDPRDLELSWAAGGPMIVALPAGYPPRHRWHLHAWTDPVGRAAAVAWVV